jgi:hypothetical protein
MGKHNEYAVSLKPMTNESAILFVDFDGVLHPDAVYASGPKKSPNIKLQAAGHRLFENTEFLESALMDYPHVAIVLSTTWCLHYGFEYAKGQLTPSLQSRVLGTTFDPKYPHFWRMPHWSRYDQILSDVSGRRPAAWLAVDDDPLGWPEIEQYSLVLTTPELGLACITTQAEFRRRLAEVF